MRRIEQGRQEGDLDPSATILQQLRPWFSAVSANRASTVNDKHRDYEDQLEN
jgi:hypothetical protein